MGDGMEMTSMDVVFAESTSDRKRRDSFRKRRSSSAEATVITIYIVTLQPNATVDNAYEEAIKQSVLEAAKDSIANSDGDIISVDAVPTVSTDTTVVQVTIPITTTTATTTITTTIKTTTTTATTTTTSTTTTT